MTPVVTLHHFSSPKWLIQEGGWESESTIEFFGKYCEYVVDKLGEYIPYICTINEANMGLQITKIMQGFMQQNLDDTNSSEVQVGINKEFRTQIENFGKEVEFDIQSLPGGEEFVKKEQEEDFLHYLPYIKDDDFFGVQNYTRKIFGANGLIAPDENTKLTQAGYEFCPEALSGVLRFVVKHWKKPLLITENGVSTTEDTERIDFINRALRGVYDCVQEGITILGYLHWSLLDNFEWQIGYEQKFGLIEVDRGTQTRYPKKSLSCLGDIKKFGITE